ncbi:GxxExxY protein [Luteimonas sp. MC1825]|uniref:GxxExxY protein n=1 Tax=Luteimonas sp. MC1825 TaxID=2761107 RepID=UPI001C866FF1|nr:GxxExxY protein [Luteimonas sp. MC1825]
MGFDMGRVEERVGRAVVDVAVAVHREMGPGLLESVYEVVMGAELGRRGFAVRRQVPVSINWRDLHFEEGFRADMIVDGCVLLELKSVEHLHNAHRKQLLTYLRLTNLKLGYLLNFAEPLMRQGITRTVNNL